MRRSHGFTLIELLVVLIIIGLVATMSLSLMGVFSQSTSVKGSAENVSATFSLARQKAANIHKLHFIKFEELKLDGARTGAMSIYEDTNKNRTLDVGDTQLEGKPTQLIRFVYFDKSPTWIGVGSQEIVYPSGYETVQSDQFYAGRKDSLPVGDLVLGMENQPYKSYIDIRTDGDVEYYFYNPTAE